MLPPFEDEAGAIYPIPMQCLRCPQEALPGRALCASCFAEHQKKIEFEETDDWVKQQLESTRNESRGRQRESKGPETSPQSLVLALAPALLVMGGLVMLSVWFLNSGGFTFTPTPDSEHIEGVPVPVKKGAEQASGTSGNQPSPQGQAPAAQAPNSSGSARNEPRADDPIASESQPNDVEVFAPTPTSTPTTTPTATAGPA
jgi:cytoskeletal protein RodZ